MEIGRLMSFVQVQGAELLSCSHRSRQESKKQEHEHGPTWDRAVEQAVSDGSE